MNLNWNILKITTLVQAIKVLKLKIKSITKTERKKIINDNNETQMNMKIDNFKKSNDDLIFCPCELKFKKSYLPPTFLSLAFIVINVILLIYSAVVRHRNHNNKKN